MYLKYAHKLSDFIYGYIFEAFWKLQGETERAVQPASKSDERKVLMLMGSLHDDRLLFVLIKKLSTGKV